MGSPGIYTESHEVAHFKFVFCFCFVQTSDTASRCDRHIFDFEAVLSLNYLFELSQLFPQIWNDRKMEFNISGDAIGEYIIFGSDCFETAFFELRDFLIFLVSRLQLSAAWCHVTSIDKKSPKAQWAYNCTELFWDILYFVHPLCYTL